MSDPEEIRRDIERTRAQLSDNVEALGASANPGNIVRGQVDKVKDAGQDLKTRIFGSPYDPYDEGKVGDAKAAVGDAKAAVGGALDDAKQAVADAPRQAQRRVEGSPLAAGLVALGIGALIGGLLPSSRAEKDIARDVKDRAQPMIDEAKSMAMEAKDRLQPMAEEAVESVKQTATDAAQQVKSDATDAKDTVAGQAQASADTVRSDAQSAVDQTKSDVQNQQSQQSGF